MRKLKIPITIILLCGFAALAFTQSTYITTAVPPYTFDTTKFLNAAGQWATVSGGGVANSVSNNVASAGLLAVDATKTNGIAATFVHVTSALGYTPVNKAGDSMSGALTGPSSTWTNGITAGASTFTGTVGFTGTSTLLNLPSLTTAQKNAASAQAGSQVYDSDLGRVQMYDGAAWHSRVRLDGDTMTGTLTIPQLITYSVRPRNLVLTHAGTVTLDFSTNTYQKLVLTGAVTLAFSNLETNRTYQLTIANAQATNCSYVLPAVTYMGYYPTNIVAGKVARWWFDVDPQTNSIVYATYAEQQ